MRQLIKSEFIKTIRRKDAIILLALSLWPAFVSIMSSVGSDLFGFKGEPMGAFEFTNVLLLFQDMIFLPVLVMVYISSMSLYQEIHNKQIYFYKDLSRRKVLDAKYISVYGVYFIFLILYIVTSFIFYFLVFYNEPIATGTFVGNKDNIIPLVYESIQVILGIIFYVHIGFTLSINYSTGVSIFGTTLIYMILKIAPNLNTLKYFVPIGYRNMLDFGTYSFQYSLVLSLIVWLIYNVAIYFFNQKRFKTMEF